MIDWHCHILPALDDGSGSVSESLELLSLLASQGIETVIATPHFFADSESVDSFINRRQHSFDTLTSSLTEDHPKILLGAEVKYYPGISRMNDLEKLCIENTNLLLLEMPCSQWKEFTLRELFEISATRGLKIILAHVERYFPMQDKSVWNSCLENGILIQVNSSYLYEFFTKRKAISNLERGKIHFIGSDCHNLKLRPPRIDEAFAVVKNKLGSDFLEQMNEFGYMILKKNI